MKKLRLSAAPGPGGACSKILTPPYTMAAPNNSFKTGAYAWSKYPNSNTPAAMAGSKPMLAARMARQSRWCKAPGKATRQLASDNKLTRAASAGTGARPSPLATPMTIMPRPKPVTVWKYVPAATTPSSASTGRLNRKSASTLGLHGRDRNHVVHIVGAATARQIVGRLVQALQQRADGDGAAHAFGQLVADIARVQVREHQHVRAAIHHGILDFSLGNLGHDGRIELHVAIDGQQRTLGLDPVRGRMHLVDGRVVGAAAGGKRQHGHARLFHQQGLRAVGGGNGDVGQLFRFRIDHQGAIGKDKTALQAVERF